MMTKTSGAEPARATDRGSTRRGIIKVAGVMAGGAAVSMLPPSSASAAAQAPGRGLDDRRLGCFLGLAESLLEFRKVTRKEGMLAEAVKGLAGFYAQCAPDERGRIDTALDAVAVNGTRFVRLPVAERLTVLSELLAGARASEVETAIALASTDRDGLASALHDAEAGRLLSMAIRAYPTAKRKERAVGCVPCRTVV